MHRWNEHGRVCKTVEKGEKMKHLFASDYDGTLFKNHEITEKDLTAIQTFQSEGHKFGIVTGRSIHSIISEIDLHKIPVDFVVGVNGAVVLDKDRNELFISKIDKDAAKEVLNYINQYDVHYYGVNDGYRHGQIKFSKDSYPFESNIVNTPIEELLEAGVSGMYVGNGTSEAAITLSKVLNDTFKEHGIKSYVNADGIDIASSSVSKTTGIEKIKEHLSLEGSIFTVGDSYNDIPMLRDFNGYLMNNGERELEKYARCGIVDSVADALNDVLAKIK